MTANQLLWKFHRAPRRSLDLSLGEVTGKLRHLAQSTEADFLEVGGRLQRIRSHANKEAQAITDLLDAVGERRQRALTRAFDEVRSWAESAESATATEPLFAALEPVVYAACEPLRALEETVRVLRVLRFTTRIESAWLGDQAAGFEALVGEMRSLGEGIEEKSCALAEARDAMSRLVNRARVTVAGQEQTQRMEMLRLTTECSAGLAELQHEQERISEISAGARSDYEKLAADIGSMVLTLQSHDSVRQRLEHIVESLRLVREGLAGPSATVGAASALRTVQLQSVQLREAQAAFVRAIGEIREQLRRIGDTVADYPRRSRELAGHDYQTGSMEARFTAILATMTELGESRRLLFTAAQEVHCGYVRMIGFVADIESLGERLVRLGLNAEVQAVQLSCCGDVMESVASHIRRIAQRASESAKAAGAALRQLEAPAARLSAALGKESGADLGDPHGMASNFGRLTQDLSTAQVENRKLLASIADGADALAKEIAALRTGITADAVANQVAASCLDTLDHVAQAANRRTDRLATSLDTRALEHASAMYTMHAERDAHQSFASATAGCLAPPSEMIETASEFGGNVELF